MTIYCQLSTLGGVKKPPPKKSAWITVRQAAALIDNVVTGEPGVVRQRAYKLIDQRRIASRRTVHGMIEVSRKSVEKFNRSARSCGPRSKKGK